MMITNDPRVSPIPFCTESVMASKGIPNKSPVIIETTRKARKAFIFPHVISTTSNKIPSNTGSKVIDGNGLNVNAGSNVRQM
jgi:hypothetical protein